MPVNDSERLERDVLKTANRLRLIQVDFADQSNQTRIEYLSEEIERALKTVLPEERNEFLERLMVKFPTGEVRNQLIPDNQQAKGGSVVEADKLKNADFLVQCLLEIVSTLSEDQKESIDKSLVQAGLRHQVPQDFSVIVKLHHELREKLHIDSERSLNTAQLVKLSEMLIDFVLKLEHLVWNAWHKMSPRSYHRPQTVLAAKVGQFLCENPEIHLNQVGNDLKMLQWLIAGLIAAVGQVGRQFAKYHLAKFSPSEIKELVKWEEKDKTSLGKLWAVAMEGEEKRCWEKYQELAESLSEDSIEMAIIEIIVRYVETIPPLPLQKGIEKQR